MGISTLARANVQYFRTAIDDRWRYDLNDDGTGTIYSVPVFREGTFRDSMGEQHTYLPEHLQQMVFNFTMLRNNGTFPNVPQRDHHRNLFGSGGRVCGFVSDLRAEGSDERGRLLLVADLEFTEPDDLQKVLRGTWRARSAEIGMYEDNDEALFWPVFMGVAWVDIPAVEGLFSKKGANERATMIPIHDEEAPVTKRTDNGNSGAENAPDPSAGQPSGQGQGAPSPGSTSSEPGDEGRSSEGQADGKHQQGSGESTGNSPGNRTSNHGTAPSAPSGASGMTVHQFNIGGSPTTDFAAVQRHIDALEASAREMEHQSRRDFVSNLASTGRIAAPMVDSMAEHVIGLTDDQYEKFRASWEAAPKADLFANHGVDGGPSTDSQTDEEERIEVLRETVSFNRRGGMSDERIEKTNSYKELMRLTDGKG